MLPTHATYDEAQECIVMLPINTHVTSHRKKKNAVYELTIEIKSYK